MQASRFSRIGLQRVHETMTGTLAEAIAEVMLKRWPRLGQWPKSTGQRPPSGRRALRHRRAGTGLSVIG